MKYAKAEIGDTAVISSPFTLMRSFEKIIRVTKAQIITNRDWKFSKKTGIQLNSPVSKVYRLRLCEIRKER